MASVYSRYKIIHGPNISIPVGANKCNEISNLTDKI